MKASERHRLKQDKYVQAMTRAVAWGRRNQKSIAVAVAIAVLAAALSIWLGVAHRAVEALARELLTEAEAKAQMALFEKPDLQAKAVNDVVSRCEMIAADYPKSAAARLALLEAAQLLARSKRAGEAVPYFERALKLSGRLAGLTALARRGLAEALEESGKLRKAIAQYRMLAAEEVSPEAVRANWDIGRCHETLGEADQAAEHYRKAADYGGASTWAKLARSRLSRLLEKEVSPSPSPGKAPAGEAEKNEPSPAVQKQ